MSTTLNPRKVDFKFGEYISQAIDLMKKDFGTLFLSFLCTMVLSIIPFCGLMAIGNFYRICYKIDKGIPTGAREIFDFEDFLPYFIFQLYIFGAALILMIPFLLFMPSSANGDDPIIYTISIAIMVFLFAVYLVLIYFLLRAFYIPALITFKKITDIKTAWNISKIMTKGNLLNIFFFSLATAFLGELGVILCGIGIFLTLPFISVAHYFAFKDALSQIESTENQLLNSNN